MRIALCDDEKAQQDIIMSLIKRYQTLRPNFDVSVDIFSDADELFRYLDAKKDYDLYILDIIMPRIDGVELATKLRERNCESLIVYITVSPDFVVESYQIQAFHYLLKPISAAFFFEMLDKAYSQLKTYKTDIVAVKTAESVKILRLSSILYAELIDRSVQYNLMNGDVVRSVGFRGSFQREIAFLLNKGSFALSGASFAVNLRHVAEIKKSDVVLTGGVVVPVSRNVYSAFKRKWMIYWLDGWR